MRCRENFFQLFIRLVLSDQRKRNKKGEILFAFAVSSFSKKIFSVWRNKRFQECYREGNFSTWHTHESGRRGAQFPWSGLIHPKPRKTDIFSTFKSSIRLLEKEEEAPEMVSRHEHSQKDFWAPCKNGVIKFWKKNKFLTIILQEKNLSNDKYIFALFSGKNISLKFVQLLPFSAKVGANFSSYWCPCLTGHGSWKKLAQKWKDSFLIPTHW